MSKQKNPTKKFQFSIQWLKKSERDKHKRNSRNPGKENNEKKDAMSQKKFNEKVSRHR